MTGLRVCIITIILTAIYFVLSVATTNIIFTNQSNGSLITKDNKILGSRIIGQNFTKNIYFHGRPSLNNYRNNISGNSNFPYYSAKLRDNISNNILRYKEKNHNSNFDLNIISESASGLDPHITYQGAIGQIERISASTGISKGKLINLITKKSKPRIFGIFGEKIVNVLELNIELNNTYAKETRS
jgi:K+-transporting ATPase ATPase C chain